MDDIEKDFHDDCRQKKIIGHGVYSRIKKGILFVVDKKARRAGKVEKSNMYDTIIKYESFKQMPDDEMAKYLTEYRNRFTNDEIIKAFGITKSIYYDLAKDLKVPRAPRTRTDSTGKRKVRGGTGVKNKRETLIEETETVKQPKIAESNIVPINQTIVIPKVDGLNLSYTGVYEPKQILLKLEKLSLLLDDEENKFDIKIFIQETEDKVVKIG